MNEDDFEDLIKDDSHQEVWYEVKKPNPVVANIILWSAIVGGVAAGIVLFLFFLTLFIYVFLPLALIFIIWYSLKRWHWSRQWKKIVKSMKE